jgi:ribosome biogenesis GTPase
VEGFVVAVDRGRYTTLVEPERAKGSAQKRKQPERRLVTAMKARELGRKGIVVGDRVALVGDVSGRPDALARVVRVEPRTSMLRRSADDVEDTDGIERPVVANADQLVIVTALADPPPRPRMIDRILVAAFDAEIETLLCLTKSDLAPPDELVAMYEPLGVSHVVVHKGGSLDQLRDHLTGRLSVMVGHSGVGKSTLVNALVPAANRAVSQVNAVTGRGRHTSTSAVALELPEGGWIIDDPAALRRTQLRPGPRVGRDGPRLLPRPHRRHGQLPQGLHPPGRRLRAGPLGGGRARRAGPSGVPAPPPVQPGGHPGRRHLSPAANGTYQKNQPSVEERDLPEMQGRSTDVREVSHGSVAHRDGL